MNASTAIAAATTVRRRRARSATSDETATDASTSGAPSGPAMVKDVAAAASGTGARGSWRRSDTGALDVGMTYSLDESRADEGAAA